MAKDYKPHDSDAILKKALKLHDKQQLAALELAKRTHGDSRGESRAVDKILRQSRVRLAELQSEKEKLQQKRGCYDHLPEI